MSPAPEHWGSMQGRQHSIATFRVKTGTSASTSAHEILVLVQPSTSSCQLRIKRQRPPSPAQTVQPHATHLLVRFVCWFSGQITWHQRID